MNKKEIISKLVEMLDNSTFKKGFMNIVDGPIYNSILTGSFNVLEQEYPEVAQQLLELGSEFIEKDNLGMIDEAADLVAEITKLIYLTNHKITS